MGLTHPLQTLFRQCLFCSSDLLSGCNPASNHPSSPIMYSQEPLIAILYLLFAVRGLPISYISQLVWSTRRFTLHRRFRGRKQNRICIKRPHFPFQEVVAKSSSLLPQILALQDYSDGILVSLSGTFWIFFSCLRRRMLVLPECSNSV